MPEQNRAAQVARRPGPASAFRGRALFAELLGTFLLTLVASGGVVVDQLSHGAIGRPAEVTGPALMVMAIILFMGGVGGAHVNPTVTLAFALRQEFPWKRVPGYVLSQLTGAALACLVLTAMFGPVAMLGATQPGAGATDLQAMVLEMILTAGLVSTILGTASSAQNVGPLSALAIGGYIALAGLWSSPLSGASMNPARSFGPAAVTGDFAHYWVYIAGPVAGALAAVAFAFVLRGPGGDVAATKAAQGGAPLD